MQDYRVELDAYNGPLDLLLFLVRQHEIDLYDIPVAKLTDQYMAYLRAIERIDVELAGEFLVMASTLLEIKSRMLLPLPEASDPEATDGLDELDPRYELVQQLLAYKRYKDAALELDERKDLWAQRHPRQPGSASPIRKPDSDADELDPDAPRDAELVEFDLEDANVMDLCEAFVRILDSIGQGPGTHQVVYDDTPMALHAEDILDRLQRLGGEGASITLAEIFVGRRSRSEMIGLFLATLALVYQRKLRVTQDRRKGEVSLALTDAAEQADAEQEKAPDWTDPKTGEIQYDWPSKEDRERAEERAKRRAELRAAKEAEDDDQAEEPQDVEEEPFDDQVEADDPDDH